jgi:hypothetical protein
MHARASALASALLGGLCLCAGGCDDSNGDVRASMLGPTRDSVISVEPSVLVPEVLTATPSCVRLPGFRTAFTLVVRPRRELFLRQMSFALIDRTGGAIAPRMVRTDLARGTTHVSPPVSMPSSAPIPIPTTLPFQGVPMSSGSNRFDLTLEFGCGVTPGGTLVIGVDAADSDGGPVTSELRVRVGAV